MFIFLTRSRHGPLLQLALGVVFVVIGLFVLTKILLVLGGLLIVWGIVATTMRLRARRWDREDSGSNE
jgi:uncharacterized membrane protein HdeD (DUF308 family)